MIVSYEKYTNFKLSFENIYSPRPGLKICGNFFFVCVNETDSVLEFNSFKCVQVVNISLEGKIRLSMNNGLIFGLFIT